MPCDEGFAAAGPSRLMATRKRASNVAAGKFSLKVRSASPSQSGANAISIPASWKSRLAPPQQAGCDLSLPTWDRQA